MIAGTLALLEETSDEPLESNGSAFATLDVQEDLVYLDGASVQSGKACSFVEGRKEEIIVNGTDIEIEPVATDEHVWTEWVADVVDAGFVVAERTAGDDPEFPFEIFEARCRTRVRRATIDPGAFVRRQEEQGREVRPWYAGRKQPTESISEPDDVAMSYGRKARSSDAREAEVGVGFKLSWNGSIAKGIIYASGYLSIYNSSWGPIQFARFVRDDILPVAEVVDDEQEILNGGDA